jgi:hypothetical protein
LSAELHLANLDGQRWPTYRPRRAVVARRLTGPTTIDGRMYRDGYLVRDETGRMVVVGVAEFEAVYELAGRDD